MIRALEYAAVRGGAQLPPMGKNVREHILKYKNPAARDASASAWALLYETLQKFGLPIYPVIFGEHGKPMFSEGGVFFSLSHAGALTAVSVADVPTGVDIERTDRAAGERLARRCLNDREWADYDGDFFRLWCRKESLVKLTGEGLYGYPDTVDSGDPTCEFTERTIEYGGAAYRLCAAYRIQREGETI